MPGAGFADNMLSRTDLQRSGFPLPHGELSLASMFIELCCRAVFMEAVPEQACEIEMNTNAKTTIDAVMIENFLSMFDSGFVINTREMRSIHRRDV